MRWFVVFLVVANLILFFWLERQSSHERPTVASLPAPDIGRLQLVEEADSEPPDAPAPVASSEEPVPAATPDPVPVDAPRVSETGGEPVSPEPGPGPGPEPEPEPEAELEPEPELATASPPASVDVEPAPGEVAGQAAEETAPPLEEPAQTVEAPAPPAAPPVEVAVAMTDPEVPTVAPSEAPATGPPPAVATVDPVCGRVGPFEPDQAEQLLAQLPAYLALLSDTSEESEQIDNYYVLIPALPDIAAGLEKLDELAEAGIEDTWLFRRGPLKNAISLGLFRREAGAKRRVAEVGKKGFEAELFPRVSRVEHRWLLLKHLDGGEIASSLPLPDGIRVDPRDCP